MPHLLQLVLPDLLVVQACTYKFVISYPTDLVIGWEQNITRVNEGQSFLELCIRVLNLEDTIELPAGFDVGIAANSIRGTAAGELPEKLILIKYNITSTHSSLHEDPGDYTALHEDVSAFYTAINDNTRRTCLQVEIIDDELLEEMEFFSIEIFSFPYVTDLEFPTDVQLDPDVAFVEILDNDCKCLDIYGK